MHPTSGKGFSANFACMEFSEDHTPRSFCPVQWIAQYPSEGSEGCRVAPPVVGDDGVVVFRSQESLLRYVTLASASYLQRRSSLYVAVPVGFLPQAESTTLSLVAGS
jgi:hypothetical protein